MDIKSVTDEQQMTSELLAMMGEGRGLDEIVDRTVSLLKDCLSCDAVGIRILDKAGRIPYQSYRGFSEKFLSKEGKLSVRHQNCVCTYITRGEFDPSLPLYTGYGSFFTNELQELNIVKKGMKDGLFRGECLLVGWESLAVVPIRFCHRSFGVIHAVSKEKGWFPPDRIRLMENIAGQVALFMHGQEMLAHRENEFSMLMQRIIHDLSSPLGNMGMFTELIESEDAGRLSAQSIDMLHRISRNVDYMGQLVNGLSSFSQAFSRAGIHKTAIDLSGFIGGLLKDMGLADRPMLKVVVPEGMPTVMYPKTCLTRILTNLISNAVKFTAQSPEPTVTIGIIENEGFYQISVADNGAGIEEGELGKVFDPFYRAEEAKGIPGSGLGLSIARKIVERNGGSIWVYSDKGKGSTFYFTLPK